MPKRVRFAELLQRHEKEIHRFVYRISGNADDASDLLQETFLRAFQAFPRLPEDANHRAWLYRIAHRQGHLDLAWPVLTPDVANRRVQDAPDGRALGVTAGPWSLDGGRRCAVGGLSSWGGFGGHRPRLPERADREPLRIHRPQPGFVRSRPASTAAPRPDEC